MYASSIMCGLSTVMHLFMDLVIFISLVRLELYPVIVFMSEHDDNNHSFLPCDSNQELTP